jgi:hypothetical protein
MLLQRKHTEATGRQMIGRGATHSADAADDHVVKVTHLPDLNEE